MKPGLTVLRRIPSSPCDTAAVLVKPSTAYTYQNKVVWRQRWGLTNLEETYPVIPGMTSGDCENRICPVCQETTYQSGSLKARCE